MHGCAVVVCFHFCRERTERAGLGLLFVVNQQGSSGFRPQLGCKEDQSSGNERRVPRKRRRFLQDGVSCTRASRIAADELQANKRRLLVPSKLLAVSTGPLRNHIVAAFLLLPEA